MTGYVVEFVGKEMKPKLRSVRSRATEVQNGQVTWRKGHEPGQVFKVPEEMQRSMFEGLPPEARTSPREKFEALLQQLITDARTMFLRDGVVRWPESIKRQLVALGWREGKPNLWDEVEMITRHYVEMTANKQREEDRKKVVRDGHGHYGA
jgi:hypothetical protein